MSISEESLRNSVRGLNGLMDMAADLLVERDQLKKRISELEIAEPVAVIASRFCKEGSILLGTLHNEVRKYDSALADQARADSEEEHRPRPEEMI